MKAVCLLFFVVFFFTKFVNCTNLFDLGVLKKHQVNSFIIHSFVHIVL